MKNYRKMVFGFTIIAFAFLLMGTYAWAADEKPSGSVHFEEEQFMLLLGGDSGKGTLGFKGKVYTFKMHGITAGGAGFQKLSATGNVYHLNKVSDFPGTYTVLRAGLTVGGGAGGLWLKNDRGVYINVTTHQEGLALGAGLEGLTISMD